MGWRPDCSETNNLLHPRKQLSSDNAFGNAVFCTVQGLSPAHSHYSGQAFGLENLAFLNVIYVWPYYKEKNLATYTGSILSNLIFI